MGQRASNSLGDGNSMSDMISLHEGEKGLNDECMGYLRTKMLFADELCPLFLASIGCHIANEYQLKSGNVVHSYKGIKEDLCFHIAIISPSGFSKGHVFQLFLNRSYGISPHIAKIAGKVTEAGYVGTIKESGYIPGLASKYSHGILAFNEISNLLITSESQHSGELINQVQESLTERHIHKSLASGEIDFDTYLTLWGASQPGRFDFSGGLGRRLGFVTKAWTKEDMLALKKDRRERKEKKVDYSEGLNIRHKLELLKQQFEVERVLFEDKVMEYVCEVSESHLDMGLMEKALIGKNVLDWEGEKELRIRYSENNKSFLDLMSSMKQKVSMGTNISLMMNVVSDRGSSRGELWNMFRRFGYTFEKFEELLELCLKLNLLGVNVKRTNEGVEKTFFKKSLKVV